MKKILFVLCMLMNFIVFGGDEIVHISKVYSDGTPKEIIIYSQVSNNLKSDNPFQIVEKITYNTKGEYIGPRITGSDLRNAKSWIVGSWSVTEDRMERGIITFDKNGSITEGERGFYSIIQKDDKIVMEWIDDGGNYYYPITFNNRNEFIINVDDRQIIANRVK